jgi:predicted SnoaL-like aldol condensation-catalyzing enzyme
MRAFEPSRAFALAAIITLSLGLAPSSPVRAHPLFGADSRACPHGKLLMERHKQTVTSFYETSFNEGLPALAVEKYVGQDQRGEKLYIQHNPQAPDGAQGFIEYVSGFKAMFPESNVEIVRVIAECDLVVTHSHFTLTTDDRGSVGVDIFRLDSRGKIVEHWDVIQAIPETSANDNGMI